LQIQIKSWQQNRCINNRIEADWPLADGKPSYLFLRYNKKTFQILYQTFESSLLSITCGQQAQLVATKKVLSQLERESQACFKINQTWKHAWIEGMIWQNANLFFGFDLYIHTHTHKHTHTYTYTCTSCLTYLFAFVKNQKHLFICLP